MKAVCGPLSLVGKAFSNPNFFSFMLVKKHPLYQNLYSDRNEILNLSDGTLFVYLRKNNFMIKSVFVITFISMASVSFAQTTTPTTKVVNQPAVQFGLKAGVNLANLKTEFYDDSKARTSFYAGGLAHIHLNEHLALQPELVYSRQGFEQTISSNYDVTGKIDYINIPVMLQYMNSGVRLETGPQLGFLVNTQYVYSDGRDDDVEDRFKSTDFSWGFGASYVTTPGIGISARYNLGISNINKDITAAGVSDPEINNRVWQFGLFYQFAR